MSTEDPADRAGLHAILGYGTSGVRLVNLLVKAGIDTPEKLRRTTYAELGDLPGVGEKLLDHAIVSLEYADQSGEGCEKERGHAGAHRDHPERT